MEIIKIQKKKKIETKLQKTAYFGQFWKKVRKFLIYYYN